MPLYAAILLVEEASKGPSDKTDVSFIAPVQYELELGNLVYDSDPAGPVGPIDVYLQSENTLDGEPVLLCKLDAHHNIQRTVKVRVGREDGLVKIYARYNNKQQAVGFRSDQVHVTGVWLYDESRQETFDEEDREEEEDVDDQVTGDGQDSDVRGDDDDEEEEEEEVYDEDVDGAEEAEEEEAEEVCEEEDEEEEVGDTDDDVEALEVDASKKRART